MRSDTLGSITTLVSTLNELADLISNKDDGRDGDLHSIQSDIALMKTKVRDHVVKVGLK